MLLRVYHLFIVILIEYHLYILRNERFHLMICFPHRNLNVKLVVELNRTVLGVLIYLCGKHLFVHDNLTSLLDL